MRLMPAILCLSCLTWAACPGWTLDRRAWELHHRNGVRSLKEGDQARADRELSLALAESKNQESASDRHTASLYYLATLRQKQGRLDEAIREARQCLEIRRKTLWPEHPDMYNTLYLLRRIYDAAGNKVQTRH